MTEQIMTMQGIFDHLQSDIASAALNHVSMEARENQIVLTDKLDIFPPIRISRNDHGSFYLKDTFDGKQDRLYRLRGRWNGTETVFLTDMLDAVKARIRCRH